MTSLHNRATPAQRKVLRIVAGAVKNAADAHPNVRLTPTFASSVAKRAAGTLTAQWPDVLAAAAPSERPTSPPCDGVGPLALTDQGPRRRPSKLVRRSPLSILWKRLSLLIGEAKRAGEHERAAALIEAIRLVDQLRREPTP